MARAHSREKHAAATSAQFTIRAFTNSASHGRPTQRARFHSTDPSRRPAQVQGGIRCPAATARVKPPRSNTAESSRTDHSQAAGRTEILCRQFANPSATNELGSERPLGESQHDKPPTRNQVGLRIRIVTMFGRFSRMLFEPRYVRLRELDDRGQDRWFNVGKLGWRVGHAGSLTLSSVNPPWSILYRGLLERSGPSGPMFWVSPLRLWPVLGWAWLEQVVSALRVDTI